MNVKSEQTTVINNIVTETKGRADNIDHRVSKRLKMRRLLLGLSQEEVGRAADVSIQQIQKYEKATNRIACGKLYSFSKLLKVPVGYFFNQLEESDTILGNAFVEEAEEYDSTNKPKTDKANEKEIIALVRAFNDVEDAQVRRKIVELVKSMS
ncbi:MAG: XRE family transcriptional regulator [Rickettsiaceae bacterium]|nr:MAG: XRE family transcriptional regulator [Rickettsiaceae bacterium]